MLPRHLLSWKTVFYDLLPPLIRRLGPERGDAALGALGRLAHAAWPPNRRRLGRAEAMARAEGLGGRARREEAGGDFDASAFRASLAGNVARFLARDYPLDGLGDAEALARFEVRGSRHLASARAGGRGVILLGSHLGAHIAALHWMYRSGLPVRALVQRPKHVSGYLNGQFDRDDGPHPQSGFFLRRGLPPGEAADRLLRARSALRSGISIYLNGDIPWDSPAARPGRLLGAGRTFLAVWTDLAALTGAPVVTTFCTHRPGGRYALHFDPPFGVEPGAEPEALARYLGRLDAEIADMPAEAVAHLTWPCYRPATAGPDAPPPVPAAAARGAGAGRR